MHNHILEESLKYLNLDSRLKTTCKKKNIRESSRVNLSHFCQLCIDSERTNLWVSIRFSGSPLAVVLRRVLMKRVDKMNNKGKIIEFLEKMIIFR